MRNGLNAMYGHERIDLSDLVANTHDLRFGLGLIGMLSALSLYTTLTFWFVDMRAQSGGSAQYVVVIIALCGALFLLERARARPSMISRILLLTSGILLVATLLLAANEASVLFLVALSCGYALIPSVWAIIRLSRAPGRIDVRPFSQTIANWFRLYVRDRRPRAIGSAIYYLGEATVLWAAIIFTYWQLEISNIEAKSGDVAGSYYSHYFAYLSGVLSFLVYRYSFSKFLVAISVDARDLIQYDQRPPVVLLREFGADSIHIRPRIPFLPRPDIQVRRMSTSGIPVEYTKVRVEQVIAGELSPVGPMIAIGEPGEAVPKIGASRTYFSNEEWQAGITEWMSAASVIVVLCGTSEHLGWEIEQICQRQFLNKTVFVVPPAEHLREVRARAVLDRILNRRAHAIEHYSDMICFVIADNAVRTYHSMFFHQLDLEFAIAAATRSLLVPKQRQNESRSRSLALRRQRC